MRAKPHRRPHPRAKPKKRSQPSRPAHPVVSHAPEVPPGLAKVHKPAAGKLPGPARVHGAIGRGRGRGKKG